MIPDESLPSLSKCKNKQNYFILFVISFNIKFLEFFEERLACSELQEESSMMKDEDEELCLGNPNIC